jgi:hypothetical protein
MGCSLISPSEAIDTLDRKLWHRHYSCPEHRDNCENALDGDHVSGRSEDNVMEY